MKIILTHEQTDFDGLASLLAASLLDDTSIPVLPRRLNRNVRAFLTFYGVDLPFVDPRDLDQQKIDLVTLVDTQSVISIKGMHSDTAVQVIDHHPQKENTPLDWQLTIQDTGANTTILVEAIEAQDFRLSVVEATLLLLGIYEDTGSLTYTRTTPRDVRAAAFLLERGASLNLVHDYIKHPLSLQQQAIYDQLRSAAKTYHIKGHRIVVAPGNALGMDEELSTIAHKLRDLLDPDGIFLIISIRGGVQLIGRSTTNQIDVSKIADHFGGGGHSRAAAALIKSREVESIVAELLEILPQMIQPGLRVADIMSGIPQVLGPHTPVQDIAQRMQRFGYEGYPVVDSGQIIGLVNRREVDRAISHRLNLTAEKLMEAGEIHIHPNNTIEDLQNLMTESGWGQIPVLDRETHTIIGIVTRTDLLKTLTPKSQPSGRRNLAEKLQLALPPVRLELLTDIAAIAQKRQTAIYIVGGFVRDLLLKMPSLDFDIVVEGDAIELAKAVKEKFGGRITTHQRFGTAKWFLNGSDILVQGNELPETLDFISARTEFYTHPTALPTVERGSIKLDLHRRDFTINTLAVRLDGHHFGDLHDYWGGYNDLKQGLVRILHSLSFIDDPTRMLRAVRYEQRYSFHVGKRTLQLLLEARPLIDRISGDRVRHEIDNILAEERALLMLDRLDEVGLLAEISPNLIWDSWIRTKLAEFASPGQEWGLHKQVKGVPLRLLLIYTLWWMRLSEAQIRQVAKRLRVSRPIKECALEAQQIWTSLASLSEAKPSQYVALLKKAHPAAIYAVFCACEDDTIRQGLENYITHWQFTSPNITGHDLQALGLAPGPEYKKILNDLRNAWLDSVVTTPEEEQAYFKKRLDNSQD